MHKDTADRTLREVQAREYDGLRVTDGCSTCRVVEVTAAYAYLSVETHDLATGRWVHRRWGDLVAVRSWSRYWRRAAADARQRRWLQAYARKG